MWKNQDIFAEKQYDEGYGVCHQCRKFGTYECPPSSMCLKYDYRPYFVPKPKKKFKMSNLKIVDFFKQKGDKN